MFAYIQIIFKKCAVKHRPTHDICRIIAMIHNQRKLSYIHNVGSEPLKPLTVGKLLAETCKKNKDVVAVISKQQNKKLTFQEVLENADRFAAGLKKIGLKYGDRLGIWAPNIIEWYVVNMACARAGLVLVAINPEYQPRETEYCINKVGIKCIVCAHKFKTQDYYQMLSHIAPELSICQPGKLTSSNVPSLESVVVISDEILKGTYSYDGIFDIPNDSEVKAIGQFQERIRMEDPFNIQFTSGTTGKPKAATVTHFQIVNNSYNIGKRTELNRKHHTICVQVPLFHAFGTVITIGAALNHASTLVLPATGYNPKKALSAIREEKCTVIHGTPTMYVDLINEQLKRKEDICPEIALTGGASCSPHLFKQMLEILKVKKVKSVYGQTEVTAVAFHSMYDDDEYHSTSTVGFIGEHLEAKVIDSEGHIVPLGVPGELCLRGYSTMLGYWDDEDKTREIHGPDRWLKTGDQFILDENGYGQIVGRIKEIIIRGGENIYPKEIEDFLNTHPDILETHVIGLPHARLGEEICACIRTREGRILTLEDIKTYCKGQLSRFKIPSVIEIVENFPKTTSGKIQKYRLVATLTNKLERKEKII